MTPRDGGFGKSYRYDQLMGLGRKVFLPLSLAAVASLLLNHGEPRVVYRTNGVVVTTSIICGNEQDQLSMRVRGYSQLSATEAIT